MSQKFYPVKYEIGKLFIVFTVGTILFLIAEFLPDTNLYFGIGIKAVLCLAFPILLYIFKFYEKSELEKIKSGLKKIVK